MSMNSMVKQVCNVKHVSTAPACAAVVMHLRDFCPHQDVGQNLSLPLLADIYVQGLQVLHLCVVVGRAA